MQRFKLTDVQAEAILNMRLRALRKLEEIEIRKEHKALDRGAGRPREPACLRGGRNGRRIADQVSEVRDSFGKKTELGRRRTDFADALRRSPSRPNRR